MGMQSSSVSSVNNNNPSFKSDYRTIVEAGNIVKCHVTEPFRDGTNVRQYVSAIEDITKDADVVTFINSACSDASETFSYTIGIKKFGKGLLDKVIHFFASDKDADSLKKAKSGICNISDTDLRRINMVLGHYSDYFSMVPSTDPYYPVALKPHDDIMGMITFKHTDMFGALDDMAPHYNQIINSNVLPYPLRTDPAYVKKYLDTLADRLDTTCTVTLGEFDNGHGIDKMLKDRHFVECCENVYTPKY